MKLMISESDDNTAEFFNSELKKIKTAEDFENLKDRMRETGLGFWFYTKRGNELNSIHTRIHTNGYRKYYTGDRTDSPIVKDGKECIAYDTVRNGTTKIIPIESIYKYITVKG